MALTRSFKNTIANRAKRDSKFRRALFENAINEFLTGNVEVAKSMLRDYINATISFEYLSKHLHKNNKSLQRMLGPNGNPTSKSLFAIIRVIQRAEGVQLHVKAQ
jgi:hypothetical protein